MKYLVTLANGRLGSLAVKELVKLVGKESVIATVRNMDKAQELLELGVEVRLADYTDKGSLVKAFEGVDKLYFISSSTGIMPGEAVSRLEQHQNVVDAAVTTGVKYVYYTSSPNARLSDFVLAQDHGKTEEYLEHSGVNYTSLRHNWYLENELNLLEGAKQGRPIAFVQGSGLVGWALIREFAEAGAKAMVLAEPKQVYELGGKLSSYAELTTAMQSLGYTTTAVELSPEQYQAGLVETGLPEATAGFLTLIQSEIARGVISVDGSELSELLGRPSATLSEALQEILV